MDVATMAQGRFPHASGDGFASTGAVVLKIHVWAPAFAGFGGGISAFSRELALGIRALGHDARLFGKLDVPGKFDGMPLWGAKRYTRMSRSHAFAGRALLAAARHRPDHIVSTHINFGPVAQVAKRAFSTPFTLVAHGIDVHPGLSGASLAALRSADRIIAVSSWTRLRVLDLGGIDPQDVVVLPNTFDEARFQPADKPSELAHRYGIREGEKVILTVARLASDERYKGYDRIIRALPELQKTCGPIRFVLVGKGEDRSRLEALASVLGVKRLVTFAGFVPDNELADHYRLADVFAMPSTGEGFGIVFLEAMACGTPVVAGNRDGSVDALDKGRLGMLVDPNDVAAIAEGIAGVLGREGPQFWYDRDALSATVHERFGRSAFRKRLSDSLLLGR
jgi:glycosyltransferase involved in cell wall biosynthesis